MPYLVYCFNVKIFGISRMLTTPPLNKKKISDYLIHCTYFVIVILIEKTHVHCMDKESLKRNNWKSMFHFVMIHLLLTVNFVALWNSISNGSFRF